MKKFVIISKTGDGISMAHQLAYEGCEVIFWNEEKDANRIGTGFPDIKRTNREEITLSDLIAKHKKFPGGGAFIFDASDWGKWQDILRKKGLPVIGSSGFGYEIEEDRMAGMDEQKKLKVPSPDSKDVDSIDNVIKYIDKSPDNYILKQTGNLPKTLNWKAERDDSLDLIYHLINVKEKFKDNLEGKLLIQKCIDGTEVACGAWFNGKTWIKQEGKILLEVNFENKKEREGDTGSTTGETGSVAKFELYDSESIGGQIFDQCLRPLEKKLIEENYIGCVDANCIGVKVSRKDAETAKWKFILLEWTLRMGYPAIDLYIELLDEPMSNFFQKLVDGVEDGYRFDLNSIGIVLVLAYATYPYEKVKSPQDSMIGEIIDLSELNEADYEHLHFNEIYMEKIKGYEKYGELPRISDNFGYAFTISYKDADLMKANEECIKIKEKIHPNKCAKFRTDIAEVVGKRMKELGMPFDSAQDDSEKEEKEAA